MSPEVSASAVLLVGVMLIRLVLADVYQRYVRVSMGPWLLLAGVLLTALGLVMAVRAVRRRAPAAVVVDGGPGPDGHAGHDHDAVSDDHHDGDLPAGELHAGELHDGHGPGGDRIGWLLLAPVLVLLLVAPPALGSFGVARTAGVRVTSGAAVWAPLPAGATPHPMTLLELNQRAWDRSGASLSGAIVQVTGFVSDGSGQGQDAGFGLARYQIACCAADAVASVIRVVGVSGTAPPRDSWATVIGTFDGSTPDGTPRITATSIQTVPVPVDPYE